MVRRIHSNPVARRQAIQHELVVRGVCSVGELCELMGASPATIRRDLAELEQTGLVMRSYGGAALARSKPAEQVFAVRQGQDRESKRSLARAAVKLVEPGQTLFLSDGSTMLELAREIAGTDMELFIATQAVNLTDVLSVNDKITVCLLGGFVRRTSFATCGLFAERMIEQINADWLFLASSGFGPQHGLSYQDPDDVALARRMLQQSQRTAALITRAKFAVQARITAVQLSEIDVLITEPLDPEMRQLLARGDIDVIETEADAVAKENDRAG
jgi:DeoR/GlpR family transcriptional regulator of sugar metabolism